MRANYKLPRRIQQKMTTELYQYWENKKEFENFDKDIIDSSPIHDETGIKSQNQISKPTEQKAIKIAESKTTRVYTTIQRRLQYVENAVKRLNADDYEVFLLIFRDGYSQIQAETQKNISYDSYYNTRNKILYYTAIEFGEI